MSDSLAIFTGAVVSVIVAYLTAKLTYRNEIGKNLYEKRQKIYFELFERLDKLKKNKYLIYNYTFIIELNELKPSIYLFAGKKVKNEFESLYRSIEIAYQKYTELFESEEQINRENGMMEEERISKGYSYEEAKAYVEEIILKEKEHFMYNHCISEKDLLMQITRIVSRMRIDLRI